jgi:hypothetical protein
MRLAGSCKLPYHAWLGNRQYLGFPAIPIDQSVQGFADLPIKSKGGRLHSGSLEVGMRGVSY